MLPGMGAVPWVSAAVLIAANAVPVFGVLYGGWRVFDILLLYSLENVVIGFYNVLKMRRAPCDEEELRRTSEGITSKAGLIGFFCLHYGIFAAGHLFFVVMLFGVAFTGEGDGLLWQTWWPLPLAFGGMWISHGVSYVRNFVAGREYERTTANRLFASPYARIVVMHVAILGGAFAVVFTGQGIAPLVILVAGKTIVDLASHLAERKRFARSAPGMVR